MNNALSYALSNFGGHAILPHARVVPLWGDWPQAFSRVGIAHRTDHELSQTISVFPLHTLSPGIPIAKKGYKKVTARSPLAGAPEPALHPAGEAESRNAPRNARNVMFFLALLPRIPRVLRLSSAALLFAGLIFFVWFVYLVVLCSA